MLIICVLRGGCERTTETVASGTSATSSVSVYAREARRVPRARDEVGVVGGRGGSISTSYVYPPPPPPSPDPDPERVPVVSVPPAREGGRCRMGVVEDRRRVGAGRGLHPAMYPPPRGTGPLFPPILTRSEWLSLYFMCCAFRLFAAW